MLKSSSIEQEVVLLNRLAWAHFFSIGFKSGEYGGKYSKVWPESLIARCIASPLWNEALSITTMLCSGKFGSKLCCTQHVNTSVFTEPDNNPIASNVQPNSAPIAFVRPLAPQS